MNNGIRTHGTDGLKTGADESPHHHPILKKLLRRADLGDGALRDLLLQPGEEGAERATVSDVAGHEPGDLLLVLDGFGQRHRGDLADGFGRRSRDLLVGRRDRPVLVDAGGRCEREQASRRVVAQPDLRSLQRTEDYFRPELEPMTPKLTHWLRSALD